MHALATAVEPAYDILSTTLRLYRERGGTVHDVRHPPGVV